MDNPGTAPTATLKRFEVDGVTRTLIDKPEIVLGAAWMDLGSARTLLQGEQMHLWSDGALRSWAW
jgi:hypothetical protein